MKTENKKWEYASHDRSKGTKDIKEIIDNINSTLTPDISTKLIDLYKRYNVWFIGTYEENLEQFYVKVYERLKGTKIGTELRSVNDKPVLQRHLIRDFITRSNDYKDDYQLIEIFDFTTLKNDIYYLIGQGIYKDVDDVILPPEPKKEYNREQTYRNYMNCLKDLYMS